MANWEFDPVQDRVQRARSAAKDGNLLEARELLEGVVADMMAVGVESPFVEWLCAVVADGLDQFVEATTRIERACRLDPVCPTFRSSRGIIYRRARAAFLVAATAPTNAKPLELYEVLLRSDYADRDVHVAAVGICSVIGQEARARSIAASLAGLAPEPNLTDPHEAPTRRGN